MNEVRWTKKEPRRTWKVYGDKTFFVEVVCWHKGYADEWAWNVYAYVYETHRHFDKPEFIKDHAPWHCGCTLDQKETSEPAMGIEYDWQKKYTTYKFGSDYAHYLDEYFATCGPDSIPRSVIQDAESLVAWLKADEGAE